MLAGWGRESRSHTVRQVLWIFAASQLLAVVAVILAWIVNGVVMPIAISPSLALVYLLLDRADPRWPSAGTSSGGA